MEKKRLNFHIIKNTKKNNIKDKIMITALLINMHLSHNNTYFGGKVANHSERCWGGLGPSKQP